MNIKEQLCETFCGALTVNRIPAGYAVGTGHSGMDGDPVGFYVIGPGADGKYQLQDDGLYVPAIEAAGADLANTTRLAAFDSLRDEYSVDFDEETSELKTERVTDDQLGTTALRFLAFLLRLQDLILMSTERAASTFKEEATKMLRHVIGDRASIAERFIVSPELEEIPADLGIVVEGRPPLALFFGLSESRIFEALLLQAYADKSNVKVSVVALLESESSISKKMRQRAANHLDATPVFRGDELAACARIAREAFGPERILQ